MEKKTINTSLQKRRELESSHREKLYNFQRKISASIKTHGLRTIQLQLEFLQQHITMNAEGLRHKDAIECYKAAIEQYINRLKMKEDARRNNN